MDSYANTDFLDIENGTDLDQCRSGRRLLFKSDNFCLHVFYDEKQFINQSHKTAIQHEIITINPPLRFKSSQN